MTIKLKQHSGTLAGPEWERRGMANLMTSIKETIRATVTRALVRLASLFLIALPVLAPWLPAHTQNWPAK